MEGNMKHLLIANEQSFQSIYLEPSPKTWQERIVFHDPIFDEEIPGVIALKSLELENLIGLVIAAPLNVLRHLREHVYEADKAEGWGKEEAATIVAKIVKAAKELGAVVVYEQLGQKVPELTPDEIPDGEGQEEQKEEAYFFDPLTKKRIVEKGPHYFDPSLVTMEDVTKKTKNRQEASRYPMVGSYPKGITNSGQDIWDEIISINEVDIFKYKSRKDRWDYAKFLYEQEGGRLGVPADLPKPEISPSAIFKKLTSSKDQCTDLLDSILMGLRKRGLSRQIPTRELAFDVRQMADNNYYLTTSKSLPLEGTSSADQVLKYLTDEYNFHRAKTKTINGYKSVNSIANITFSEDRNKPYHIKIYTIYLLTEYEALLLSNTSDVGKTKCRLMNVLNTWVKTGRLK